MDGLSAAFFTEAGSKRGMGHLVRSYTLFEKFKQNGVTADFFLDSDLNYDCQFDDIKYFNFLDFKVTKRYDVIYVDSYEARKKVYEELSSVSKVSIYMDDYERLSYPPGIIVNIAPDAKSLYFKERDKRSNYLLGLKYLPIREGILKEKKRKKSQIFIMLGGADIKGLSLRVLESLECVDEKKVIVINDRKLLDEINYIKGVNVLYRPPNDVLMKNMAKSRLAITTASMGVYELHYLRVKTVIIAINDNQVSGAKQLIKHKIANGFVNIKNRNWEKEIAGKISVLSRSKGEKPLLIDGRGSERIFNYVQQLIG